MHKATTLFLALRLSSLTTALPTSAELSIAERDAPAITFTGCTNYEIMALNDDLDDMVTLANNALNNIGSGKYWDPIFGPDQSKGVTDYWIRGRYQAIAVAKTTTTRGKVTIRCDNENAPLSSCRGFGAPMMTQGGGGGTPTIWACASYWRGRLRIRDIKVPNYGDKFVPLDPYIPTGGLLLHEWTHALYETTDVKLREHSRMKAYGQENALRLRNEFNGPFKSRNNADNYRIFAAMVTMRGLWSIDPDNLSGRNGF